MAQVGLALMLVGLVLHTSSLNVRIFAAVNAWGGGTPTLWSWLNVYGLGATAWLLIACSDRANRRRTAAFLLTLLLGGALLHFMKWAVDAPRPVAVLGLDAVHVIGQTLHRHAMPSGHTATAFAVAVLLQAGQPRLTWSSAWFWCLALAVGVSRIVSGAHWPADVLVGAGLGIVSAQLALRMDVRWGWHRRLRQPLGQRCIALAVVIVSLSLAAHNSGQPLASGFQHVIGLAGAAYGLALLAWHSRWFMSRLTDQRSVSHSVVTGVHP